MYRGATVMLRTVRGSMIHAPQNQNTIDLGADAAGSRACYTAQDPRATAHGSGYTSQKTAQSILYRH